MRIAFVDYILDPSAPATTGLSDLVWDMATRLSRDGDDVHVVAPYTTDRWPAAAVTVHKFRIPPIGYRNIVGHGLILARAMFALRRIPGIDVIHAPEYGSAALASTAFRSTPVVFTEPGNIYERIANGNPYDWSTTQTYKLAAKVAARNCAGLVATSDLMRFWWMRTGVPAGKIAVIPLGLDTGLFRRIPDAKEELGWNSETFHLLYVARLSPENNAAAALKATARLAAEHPPVHLHLVGSGPQTAGLRGLQDRLGLQGKVTWHGWVDMRRLPLLYSGADVLVFPGLSGGTPRVLLQAMACGAPVVASRIGGIVDHISDETNGLLAEPGDVSSLVAAIERLIGAGDVRRRISDAARRYAVSRLDWDVLVPRIRSEVYEKVLRGREPVSTSAAGPAAVS